MKCLLFYNQQSFMKLFFNFASIAFEMHQHAAKTCRVTASTPWSRFLPQKLEVTT